MGCGSSGSCGCRPGAPCLGWDGAGREGVVVFANNQELTVKGTGMSVVYTDPVPLRDADRASAVFNVHYLWAVGDGTPVSTLHVQGEVSNDGVHWVEATGLADTVLSDQAPIFRGFQAPAYGAFLRFRLEIETGYDLAGGCFDLHVKLDHA